MQINRGNPHSAAHQINRVERLKLTAGMVIQLCKRNHPVNTVHDLLCPVIAAGITGSDRFVTLQQHIIASPGIDGQTVNMRKGFLCCLDPVDHVLLQRVNAPDKVTILFRNTIGEAVDLAGLQFT